MKNYRILFSLLALLGVTISMTTSAKGVNPTAKVELLSDEIKADMKAKGTWKDGCVVPLERLRRVTFSYVDFEGKHHTDGEIIVMDAVADRVAKIMDELHQQKFPIAGAKRIEKYDADDDKSMDANNLYAFQDRRIANTDLSSYHSYGVAIDINPKQNPYVGYPTKLDGKECKTVQVWPLGAEIYLSRGYLRPGMVENGALKVFEKHGFRDWGGYWPIYADPNGDPRRKANDLHHIQPYGWLTVRMAKEAPAKAKKIFEFCVNHPKIKTEAELDQHFKG